MPISIYKEELEKIFNAVLNEGYDYNETFNAFLEENEGKLSVK